MIFLGNFLIAIARIVHILLMIYIWIIVFRAILSWIRLPSLYSVSVLLYRLTEPVLRPFRRIIPPYKLGGIDISPVIVILIIVFVDTFIVKSITLYAQQLLRNDVWNFG